MHTRSTAIYTGNTLNYRIQSLTHQKAQAGMTERKRYTPQANSPFNIRLCQTTILSDILKAIQLDALGKGSLIRQFINGFNHHISFRLVNYQDLQAILLLFTACRFVVSDERVFWHLNSLVIGILLWCEGIRKQNITIP